MLHCIRTILTQLSNVHCCEKSSLFFRVQLKRDGKESSTWQENIRLLTNPLCKRVLISSKLEILKESPNQSETGKINLTAR